MKNRIEAMSLKNVTQQRCRLFSGRWICVGNDDKHDRETIEPQVLEHFMKRSHLSLRVSERGTQNLQNPQVCLILFSPPFDPILAARRCSGFEL